MESVDDPLNIQQEKTSGESENIATEINGEWIDDNSLCVQEMNNSEDEENNKVVDDIIDNSVIINRLERRGVQYFHFCCCCSYMYIYFIYSRTS